VGDDRPIRYVECDDAGRETVVYRASAIGGGCLTAFAAIAKGVVLEPPPAWIQERFDEGHRFEGVVLQWDGKKDASGNQFVTREIATFESDSWKLVEDGQYAVELVVSEDLYGRRVIIRGHMDGIALVSALGPTRSHSNIKAVHEAKAFGPSYRDKWLSKGLAAFPQYQWQLSIYMHATKLPALVTVGIKSDEATEFGVRDRSKVKIEDVTCEWVDKPPIPLSRIKARVAEIEALIDSGELPDCTGKGPGAMWPCPVRYLHIEQRDETTIAPKYVGTLVQEFDAVREEIKRLEARKRELSDEIAEYVQGMAAPEIEAAGFKVKWVEKTVAEHVRKESVQKYLDVRRVSKSPDDPFEGLAREEGG
jgi:uncharacterized protein (UPF0335 family)